MFCFSYAQLEHQTNKLVHTFIWSVKLCFIILKVIAHLNRKTHFTLVLAEICVIPFGTCMYLYCDWRREIFLGKWENVLQLLHAETEVAAGTLTDISCLNIIKGGKWSNRGVRITSFRQAWTHDFLDEFYQSFSMDSTVDFIMASTISLFICWFTLRWLEPQLFTI